MIEALEIHDIEVDRREETRITQHPGYTETVKIVRDVAAERWIALFQVHRILWTLLSFLEILLAFRFLLRMIGANPDSGFSILIYGITGLFVGPFIGLITIPTSGGVPLEVTTLIAMVVYLLIFWGVEYVIWLVTDLSAAGSVTRTTQEQLSGGDGNVRRIRTTISNSRI